MKDDRTCTNAIAALFAAIVVTHASIQDMPAETRQIRTLVDIAYKETPPTDYERQRCKLDLYLPQGVTNYATLVWFHGGGLQSGDKAGEIAVTLARRLASQGIAVASANYRLSPRVSFPAYVDDAAAAVAFVRRQVVQHGGSPERVFVSGHSAGGYLAAMIGVDARYLANHATNPRDIAGFLPVSGQMVTHSTVREERGIPRTRPLIDEAAPAYFAGTDTSPFLCIVGGEDLPARAEENRYFVAAMQAAGHDSVTYFEVPGRNHNTIISRAGEADDPVARTMIQVMQLVE